MREYGIDDFSSGVVLSIQGLGTLQASCGLTRFEPASRRFGYTFWLYLAARGVNQLPCNTHRLGQSGQSTA